MGLSVTGVLGVGWRRNYGTRGCVSPGDLDSSTANTVYATSESELIQRLVRYLVFLPETNRRHEIVSCSPFHCDAHHPSLVLLWAPNKFAKLAGRTLPSDTESGGKKGCRVNAQQGNSTRAASQCLTLLACIEKSQLDTVTSPAASSPASMRSARKQVGLGRILKTPAGREETPERDETDPEGSLWPLSPSF